MNDKQVEGTALLGIVEAIAISPEEAAALVDRFRSQAQRKFPNAKDDDLQDFVADALVRRYSRWAASVGGVTGLAGIVPGIGTIIAAVGGATADAAASMKLQVDMTMCLATAYGYDLTNTDARHLSFLIAATGTLEKAGGVVATDFASKAGVRLLRQYLQGAALQAVKAFFRKIGIVFTRKAMEKALPFGVGVAIGATANFALTRYVGAQAKTWFILDRADGGPRVTLGLDEE